jgi:hypothetical protein
MVGQPGHVFLCAIVKPNKWQESVAQVYGGVVCINQPYLAALDARNILQRKDVRFDVT